MKLITVVSLLFVFAPPTFAQSTPQPPAVPAPPSTLAAAQFCPDDTLYFANWNFGMANKLCVTEGASPKLLSSFYGVYGAQKIFPLGPDSFYAVGFGKAYKLTADPNYGTQYESWRVPGGGFVFNPNPNPWEQSLSFHFPSEYDGLKVYFNWQGRTWNEPLPFEDRFRCASVVQASSGYEFCLSPAEGHIFQPLPKTPFDRPYSDGKVLLAGRQPVNMVAQGDSVYVTLGTRYDCPTTPSVGPVNCAVIPGKLIALRPQGAGVVEEVLVEGIDVLNDAYQNRLAISSQGLYFITTMRQGNAGVPVIGFYSFRTRGTSLIIAGNEGDFFSALTVVPN